MARAPQVTRTIQTTKVIALCLDIKEQKPYDKEIVLSGTYKDDKAIMKALANLINDDTNKVVHVKSTEVQETLYGMSEQEFIAHAKVLPPRSTKEN